MEGEGFWSRTFFSATRDNKKGRKLWTVIKGERLSPKRTPERQREPLLKISWPASVTEELC